MIERKNMELQHFEVSRIEKYISGAADFGVAARRSHGFHIQPLLYGFWSFW